MGDMSAAIIPKSDQINADDLISGPMTIKVRDVTVKSGQEQPVSMFFEGSDKAYRPCKSMCRVIVTAWGPDTAKYTGRSMTLFCDPKVKWGGMDVGGIRISHMSDIESALTMALTVTRANKKPFTVRPIVKAKESAASASDPPASSQATSGSEPGAADFISPDAAIDIEDKLRDAGIDKARFLKATKVSSIALLPASAYERSLAWIDAARNAKAAA